MHETHKATVLRPMCATPLVRLKAPNSQRSCRQRLLAPYPPTPCRRDAVATFIIVMWATLQSMTRAALTAISQAGHCSFQLHEQKAGQTIRSQMFDITTASLNAAAWPRADTESAFKRGKPALWRSLLQRRSRRKRLQTCPQFRADAASPPKTRRRVHCTAQRLELRG